MSPVINAVFVPAVMQFLVGLANAGEIENVLMKHPGIADAALIGVPSDRGPRPQRVLIIAAT